jgi:uncharacterized protein YjiS (DUF1127 family)
MSLIPERTVIPLYVLTAVGLDQPVPPIRRTLEGAIDYDWYLSRAREDRARAFGRVLGRAARAVARLVRHGLVEPLRERRRRERAIEELAALDDRLLRDMGIDRGGIVYAVDHGRDTDAPPANDNAPQRRVAKAA